MQLTPAIETPQPQRLKQRVLVLGTALRTQFATAYAWSDLPPHLNVAEYDVVILNFTSFLDEQLHGSVRPERLPTWQQLARLLFSKGTEIICIGVPGLSADNSLYQSMTWWLPVVPEFVFSSGEVVQDIKPDFDYYFNSVRRWFFYATPKFRAHFLGLANYMRVIHPRINNLRVGMGAIARNRFAQPIAFRMVFRAGYAYSPRVLSATASDSPHIEPVIDSGTVIWLPPPTEISADDAISLILHQRYQLASVQIPPDWVTTYTLPQQEAIALKICQYQQMIQQLTHELEATQQQLKVTTDYTRLLYERQAEALVPTVCDVLQELGASIRWSTPSVTVRFSDPAGREGVLVIRTSQHPLLLKELRLLDNAVRDLLLQNRWQGKGILVVNHSYTHPPALREAAFSSDCVRAAQELGYGLVTTTQLFQAIAAHQRHELNPTEFWNVLFESRGICPLLDLQPISSTLLTENSSLA